MEDLKKIQEFFSKPLEEVTKSQMLKKAKKGSYPATLVAIENGKVVAQEKISTPQEAPAAHSVMSKKYPNANIRLEDSTGKILNEGEQLDIVDLAKVVQAVHQTGHPVTVLLVPKWNEIEIITGMNAPDDMLFDLSNAVDSLGYGRNDIIIAADSSNLSRREYSDIRRVNGGHKDYFEESVNEDKKLTYNDFVRMVRDDMMAGAAPDERPSKELVGKRAKAYYNDYLQGASVDDIFEATKEEENEFHTKLDKLVHDTFGKRKGEMEEYNSGIYYDPAKDNIRPKAKEASKTALEKVKDFIRRAVKEGDITVDDKTEFKLDLKHLLDKHAIQKEDISDYEKEGADYDKMYSDYLYKMVKEVATEKGYSKFLVSKDNPKGETSGLDTKTMNKILMNVIKDVEETIQLGKNLNEELCPKGKAYIKKRKAAGEKSSAYLSGRAVKVCKGQMKG